MRHLEAALDEGQEMKSPTASQVRMEASNLPRSPLQSPPPTFGKKRRRSSSSPRSVRKRQSLLAEPSPTPYPLEPVLPENNWHCSNCGRPCWGCFSSPDAPADVASLDEEEDIDRLRMPSAPPTLSQDACSTRSGTTQNTPSTPSRKKRKQCLEAGITYVGPKDKDFEAAILAPLGVVFSYSPSAKIKPIETFGPQSSTLDSRVILRKNDNELQEIMQDFMEYKARGYDEHTLSTICNDSIILRDRFVYTPLFGEDQNITTSVRRDKWKPKKNGPYVPMGRYTYDWDIEPDATYAVSIRTFDVKHRRELNLKERHPWIAESAAVCPYLTIEYKCTEETGKSSDARYQNTAASVLWLHQRKQIRQALGLTLANLKHFSITFLDSNYTIWEARFRDGLYHLHNLVRGDLTTMDDLKLFIEWNNAIHSWGLGANASSFKEDIMTLLERGHDQQPFPTPRNTHSPVDASQKSDVVQHERKDSEEKRSDKGPIPKSKSL